MSATREFFARCGSLFSKPTARLAEELEAHAGFLAADYMSKGMPEREARDAARRELGNLTSVTQQYREQSGLPWLENLWLDLKYTLRTLRRNPTFSIACIAALTVGLAAMITVVGVLSALLWRPLPYPHPESLVVLNEMDPRNSQWSFSEPMLCDLQERSRSLSAIAGYRFDTLPLTGSGDTEPISSAAVTPAIFRVFGITPILGTVLQDSESYVFVSRALWKRKWQMDPRLVGRSIILGGTSYTVAGIGDLPAEFLPGVELFHLLIPKASESRTAHDVEVVARVRDRLALGQAQAELSKIASQVAAEHAQTNAGWGIRVMSISNYLVGPKTNRMLWMIFAAVGLLWVLVCINVAGLQIARNIARRQEMSTRLALGAGRGRLLSQTLTESLVLAIAAGILGTVTAPFAMAAIREFGSPYFPLLATLQLDAGTIWLSLAGLLLSTVLFGGLSGYSTALLGMAELRARSAAKRDRGRDALIIIQVALASILLLGAGLLFQSFLRLHAVDPGFNPDRVLTVRVSLPATAQEVARRVEFFRDASRQLARLPEVVSVGATNVVPFSGHGTANRFRVEGESGLSYHTAAWRAVTPGFFNTLGISLKAGRRFTDADIDGSLEVVIISESMARQFWPNRDPVGQRLLWGRSQNPKTIVGVVGDLRDLTVDSAPVPTMFRPFTQLSDAPMTLLIRTKQDPAAAAGEVRRQLWALDRNTALESQPLTEAMAASILRPQASLMAVSAFAILALINAAFGLYGLISYRVNQRQQEIGIRLALGEASFSVQWAIQRRCVVLVCCGAAMGLPVAFSLSKLISTLLFETKPTELTAYGAVFAVFLAVALTASFGPARRAAGMDPASAIRYE